jgi:MFS family permease
MFGLDARGRRVLILAGLAVALSAVGGSVLIIGLPAIAADFHAPVSALSNLGSILALGSVGALPLAALADRVGRRRVLAVAVAGFSLAAVGSSLSTSLGMLALARLVGVCFEALAAGVATAVVVEEMPAERRALAVSLLTLAAGAGGAVTTIAYPVVAPHWREIYAAAAFGLPLALVIWRLMPESRVWHEHRHVSRSVLRALLEPPFRTRLAVLAAFGVGYALLFEPAALFVVLVGSRLGLRPPELSAVIVASGIVGAAFFPVGGWAGDRFGRRPTGLALAAATAIAAGATFIAGSRTGYWAGNILWSAVSSAAAPVTGAWFAELFPTRARATSEAVSSVTAAVGSITGLQVVARLTPVLGLGPAVAACAVPALAAVGILFALPESRGRPLPD